MSAAHRYTEPQRQKCSFGAKRNAIGGLVFGDTTLQLQIRASAPETPPSKTAHHVSHNELFDIHPSPNTLRLRVIVDGRGQANCVAHWLGRLGLVIHMAAIPAATLEAGQRKKK